MKSRKIRKPVIRQSDLLYRRVPKFSTLRTGVEVQTWGLDANQQLVCCGPHFVPEFSAKWIYLLWHNWRRWRKWYDNLPEHRGENYPAKSAPMVAYWGAHPIDDRMQTKWITV